ncbi:ABC transporter permease [Clostridium tarantellae]|uniref:ABC transporter permease subunit n=1 Tax=Clostridium tarantellae TaxID=39493 RepID=A0A6I1MLS3_9CLOT|nr:ABC transporter permease [Clostridium tarantellae]MPQ44375.1 ABC transporter permease subunit [Clostridium tarantellae]
MKNKKSSLLAYPYFIWSTIFIVIPLLLILFFSFTTKENGTFVFTIENYKELMDPLYLKVFARSLYLAILSTLLCLIIGYPISYIISKMNIKKRNLLILLFILPMWMNFLLRTYAWMAILSKNGIVNKILTTLGIGPFNLLYNDVAVLFAMVYNFLPFMVIPIYTVLIKIDKNLINAAYDLGATKFEAFKKVILPLSVPGIMTGITMVFMPAVSTFVISRLLGGGQYMLVGNLIEQQFTTMGDWNMGSAISMLMMLIILISMALMSKYDTNSKANKKGGGQLW